MEMELLKRTNITNYLQKTEQHIDGRDVFLKNLNDLLEKPRAINNFQFNKLDSNNVYHIDTIKTTCVNYRLRFLDVKYFKPHLPKEAFDKIKQLETEHNTVLGNLKIMAPSKLFKLEDKDDPLLFVPIGNQHYYLIHKWGSDLHPLRRIMVWPFKNVLNFLLVLVAASYLATLLVPDGLFSKSSSSAQFLIIFFFTFKSLVAVALFYGFALGKNFNPFIWNSKYFNA
ncbi:membrane protein [Croceivirga radicis]|uniref:membrane protein n=1 Tax=Croceivirga radicis TaxID=1929488 RepID=UPI000255B331|nr:membrane protein [Croceivirga radicis]